MDWILRYIKTYLFVALSVQGSYECLKIVNVLEFRIGEIKSLKVLDFV